MIDPIFNDPILGGVIRGMAATIEMERDRLIEGNVERRADRIDARREAMGQPDFKCDQGAAE